MYRCQEAISESILLKSQELTDGQRSCPCLSSLIVAGYMAYLKKGSLVNAWERPGGPRCTRGPTRMLPGAGWWYLVGYWVVVPGSGRVLGRVPGRVFGKARNVTNSSEDPNPEPRYEAAGSGPRMKSKVPAEDPALPDPGTASA